MHFFLFLFCFLMSVVWGARECADAFLLISVLFSYNVCCLGGKGMRICIPFDFCSFFFFFFMFVVWGARECADALLLISVLFSYNVCCLGGKGMRICIPFDFCSVFLCLLFGGQGNAQMHSF